MLKHNLIISHFQQLLGMPMLFWVILTKENSMINVEKRGGILHVKAQTMGTSSQISHLKTSLICSLEEVTHQVSVTVLSFHAKPFEKQYFHCNTRSGLSIKCCMCYINLGHANVYTNGRMRYQRRERRERQRDVSVVSLSELLKTADVQIL